MRSLVPLKSFIRPALQQFGTVSSMKRECTGPMQDCTCFQSTEYVQVRIYANHESRVSSCHLEPIKRYQKCTLVRVIERGSKTRKESYTDAFLSHTAPLHRSRIERTNCCDPTAHLQILSPHITSQAPYRSQTPSRSRSTTACRAYLSRSLQLLDLTSGTITIVPSSLYPPSKLATMQTYILF